MTPHDDLRLPTLDALRAFDAVARLGSFERAADALSVGASAVGKRIAALETLLGTQLLHRGSRRLELTAAGLNYLAHVRPVLAQLSAIPQHRRHVQRARKLRVCAPPTFARQVLVPELPAFGRAHPGVELEVVLSIPFLAQAASDADVEVWHTEPGSEGQTVLMHDTVLPLAAPGLLARHGQLSRPADLVTWPLLRTPLEPWMPWFRAAGLDWPEPDAGPSLLDLGMTLEAALAAQGVVLARPTLAANGLANGSLQPLFGIQATPARQYVVQHGDHADAAAFSAWLTDRCAQRARDAQALISGLI